jgi:hypothetical protein
MADITSSQPRSDDLWRAFGRHLAASTGALCALLSLVSGSSVSTASLRGALALFGVLLVTRIGAAALAGIEYLETKTPQSPSDTRAADATQNE